MGLVVLPFGDLLYALSVVICLHFLLVLLVAMFSDCGFSRTSLVFLISSTFSREMNTRR